MGDGGEVPPELLGCVRAAWASYAGVGRLEGRQVVVNPESGLSPPGWVGIVVVGDTITATVPSAALAPALREALAAVPPAETVDMPALRRRLIAIFDSFDPAALFYAAGPPPPDPVEHAAAEATPEGLGRLLAGVCEDDRDESGMGRLTGPVFVAHGPDGSVVAASGYRLWPRQVAHVCVLTHPTYRRMGYARAVSAAAIEHALAEGLLPQWRARPEASKALARSLGLFEVGVQLCFRPGG